MNQFDPEEWRQFGTTNARTHADCEVYNPLLPNAPPFYQNGVYHVSRYACYLRAYRTVFVKKGLHIPRIQSIREALNLDTNALFVYSLAKAA